MNIFDKVYATFEKHKIGEELSRADIIDLVNTHYGVPKGSIIPSDYCYNLVNKDKLYNPTLLKFNIFEYTDDKKYIYVGKEYNYAGPIFQKIDSKYQQVGKWIDGIRTLEIEFNEKDVKEPRSQNEGRSVLISEQRDVQHEFCVHKSLNDSSKLFSNIMGVSHLWNKGSKTDWENALDNYWGAVSSENMKLEQDFEDLDSESIHSMNSVQFYNFLHDEFFVWKYTAKNRLATTRKSLEIYRNNNKMDELSAIHRQLFSFKRNDIERGLLITTQIRGLGTAGASGLLSVLFPSDFGTVDQFAVKALCEIEGLKEHSQLTSMYPMSLSAKDGVIIISIFRRKASELNKSFGTNIWTPRKIDKVLWSVGRV